MSPPRALALQTGGHVHGRAEVVEAVVQGHDHAGAGMDAHFEDEVAEFSRGLSSYPRLHGERRAHRLAQDR